MNNDPIARRIQVLADPAALARAGAEELTRRALAAVRESGRAAVALSGGSTPKALYKLLATEPAFRERLPWQDLHFFFGDERHVPPDAADSNFRMAKEAMFDALGDTCPPANIHRIHCELPSASQAAEEYAADLNSFFGGEGIPRFDLVLLGMGPDGHTASLFPGTTGLRETDKLVCAAWVDKLSTYRVTLTPPVLCAAAALLFLVAGKDKCDTLVKVLEGRPEPDRYPSQGISAVDGETLWLLDEAAAAGLALR
jgi:6-phosphogluconolactonase